MLWGGAFFFAKLALAELQPLTAACGRVMIAAMLPAAIVRWQGQRLADCLAVWPVILALAFFNNAVLFTPLFWRQTHIASGLAPHFQPTSPCSPFSFRIWQRRKKRPRRRD